MRSHTPPFGSHYTHVNARPEHTHAHTCTHEHTHMQMQVLRNVGGHFLVYLPVEKLGIAFVMWINDS